MKHTDDIIRMAREVGMPYEYDTGRIIHLKQLERFAALVAAAERNKVAQWMMTKGYATGHGDTTEDLLQELEWQIAENWTRGMVNGVEAEREACAKLCETKLGPTATDYYGKTYAAAIRARGQA
jgi:hypothetical protein